MYLGNMKTSRFKKGGLTQGPSHAEGGIPMTVRSTGQKVELEGGEGVVNKTVMSSIKKVTLNGEEMTPCEAVSEINQSGGNGVAFDCYEDGGIVQRYDTAVTPIYPSSVGATIDGDVDAMEQGGQIDLPVFSAEELEKLTASFAKGGAVQSDVAFPTAYTIEVDKVQFFEDIKNLKAPTLKSYNLSREGKTLDVAFCEYHPVAVYALILERTRKLGSQKLVYNGHLSQVYRKNYSYLPELESFTYPWHDGLGNNAFKQTINYELQDNTLFSYLDKLFYSQVIDIYLGQQPTMTWCYELHQYESIADVKKPAFEFFINNELDTNNIHGFGDIYRKQKSLRLSANTENRELEAKDVLQYLDDNYLPFVKQNYLNGLKAVQETAINYLDIIIAKAPYNSELFSNIKQILYKNCKAIEPPDTVVQFTYYEAFYRLITDVFKIPIDATTDAIDLIINGFSDALLLQQKQLEKTFEDFPNVPVTYIVNLVPFFTIKKPQNHNGYNTLYYDLIYNEFVLAEDTTYSFRPTSAYWSHERLANVMRSQIQGTTQALLQSAFFLNSRSTRSENLVGFTTDVQTLSDRHPALSLTCGLLGIFTFGLGFGPFANNGEAMIKQLINAETKQNWLQNIKHPQAQYFVKAWSIADGYRLYGGPAWEEDSVKHIEVTLSIDKNDKMSPLPTEAIPQFSLLSNTLEFTYYHYLLGRHLACGLFSPFHLTALSRRNAEIGWLLNAAVFKSQDFEMLPYMIEDCSIANKLLSKTTSSIDYPNTTDDKNDYFLSAAFNLGTKYVTWEKTVNKRLILSSKTIYHYLLIREQVRTLAFEGFDQNLSLFGGETSLIKIQYEKILSRKTLQLLKSAEKLLADYGYNQSKLGNFRSLIQLGSKSKAVGLPAPDVLLTHKIDATELYDYRKNYSNVAGGLKDITGVKAAMQDADGFAFEIPDSTEVYVTATGTQFLPSDDMLFAAATKITQKLLQLTQGTLRIPIWIHNDSVRPVLCDDSNVFIGGERPFYYGVNGYVAAYLVFTYGSPMADWHESRWSQYLDKQDFNTQHILPTIPSLLYCYIDKFPHSRSPMPEALANIQQKMQGLAVINTYIGDINPDYYRESIADALRAAFLQIQANLALCDTFVALKGSQAIPKHYGVYVKTKWSMLMDFPTNDGFFHYEYGLKSLVNQNFDEFRSNAQYISIPNLDRIEAVYLPAKQSPRNTRTTQNLSEAKGIFYDLAGSKYANIMLNNLKNLYSLNDHKTTGFEVFAMNPDLGMNICHGVQSSIFTQPYSGGVSYIPNRSTTQTKTLINYAAYTPNQNVCQRFLGSPIAIQVYATALIDEKVGYRRRVNLFTGTEYWGEARQHQFMSSYIGPLNYITALPQKAPFVDLPAYHAFPLQKAYPAITQRIFFGADILTEFDLAQFNEHLRELYQVFQSIQDTSAANSFLTVSLAYLPVKRGDAKQQSDLTLHSSTYSDAFTVMPLDTKQLR
jgi:hypothetical protein